jgi:hypothetical protein
MEYHENPTVIFRPYGNSALFLFLNSGYYRRGTGAVFPIPIVSD